MHGPPSDWDLDHPAEASTRDEHDAWDETAEVFDARCATSCALQDPSDPCVAAQARGEFFVPDIVIH